MAKPIRDTSEKRGREVLSHAAYSPDLAPSDYHLFALMSHTLAEQSSALIRTKMWKNGLQQKRKPFTVAVFTNCPKDAKRV